MEGEIEGGKEYFVKEGRRRRKELGEGEKRGRKRGI